MKSNLEFLSNHILENSITEILKIEKDHIYILGIEFSLTVDNRGDFVRIKNINLDSKTSSRLTYLVWSLNFLNRTCQKSNDEFKTSQLKERVVRLLITAIYDLEKSSTLEDIKRIIKNIEEERSLIKEDMTPYAFVGNAC